MIRKHFDILDLDQIYTIDQISALMYVNHISMRQMSKIIGVDSSRLHAMFKYKDEEHNKLLRIACTWVIDCILGKNYEIIGDPVEFDLMVLDALKGKFDMGVQI